MPITTLHDLPATERLIDWVRYPKPGLYEWGEVIAPAPGGPPFQNVQHTVSLESRMPTRTGVVKVVRVILPSMAWEVIPNTRGLWDYEQSSPIDKAALAAARDAMSPSEQKQFESDDAFAESVSRYLDSLTAESRAQLFSITGAQIEFP